jgi:Fur family ferric uptake transcriptional regulator
MSRAGLDREAVVRALHAAGMRMTAQRHAILDAIASRDGHFTVDELEERLRARSASGVDRSTLYRTLDALRGAHLLTATRAGTAPLQFEVAGASHHHLVCTACGHEEEIDDSAFEPVRRYLRDRRGFRADVEHVTIAGRCAGCAEPAAPPVTTES